MFKKSKGFTLIELLIVVAIIGILAALLIPNAMTAMQKAKQKGTMKDVNTISTALMDYVTDHAVVPDHNSILTTGDSIITALMGFYVKIIPTKDQWGNPFVVNTRASCGDEFGIAYNPAANFGNDEFVVASCGRDGSPGGPNSYVYDPATPEAGFYAVSQMRDFEEDLVAWNGSWVVGPTSRGGGLAAEVTTGGD